MVNYVAIQKSLHEKAGYKHTTTYEFASHMTTVPILHEEVAHATQYMALAFQGSKTGKAGGERFELVAIQSITPNKNFFVTPDGRWLTGYRPAFYRSHPFALQANQESKELELSIDEASIVSIPNEEQPSLFGEDGNLTEGVKKVVEFLSQTLRSRQKTLELCKELKEAGLLSPWPVTFSAQDENGEPITKALGGLHHIDPKALQSLDAETLASLNASGALKIAYAQALSEPRAAGLGTLADVHLKLEANKKKQKSVDLDELFGEKDELFSF